MSYVYVTKFSNYPDLIKIGKSIVPEARTYLLSKIHGNVISTDVFSIGEGYSQVESELHKKYRIAHSNGTVVGDGCTEFFSDHIYADVCADLTNYATEGTFVKEQAIRELDKETVRYEQLLGRLLGSYGAYKLYIGVSSGLPCGYWDLVRITNCLEMGFTTEEVFSKFVSTKQTPRYTTIGRVSIAYNLFKEGTSKSRKLKEIIAESM